MCVPIGVVLSDKQSAYSRGPWLRDEVGQDNKAVRWEFSVPEGDADLLYAAARYFDPGEGVWLNNEPVGFESGDANLYPYVEPACAGEPMPPE
jgi:RHS repeat-associated protein